MKKIIIHIISVIYILLLTSSFSNSQDLSKNKYNRKVNIIIHHSLLTMVNEIDAAASLDLWAKKWLVAWNDNHEEKFDVEVKITQNENEIKKLIESKAIIVLALSALDYFNFESVVNREPLYVSGSVGDSFDQIYLVANKSSGIQTLKDLKNKSLLLPPGAHKQMALAWINVLAYQTFNLEADEVFKVIDKAESSAQTILQLYFKKYDICIIDDNSFQVMTDMNPQITKDLIILEKSFKFPHSIMVVLNTTDPEILRFVESRADQLEGSEYGRQLLKLFKVSSVVLYKKEYLEDVKSLYEKNRSIKKQK